MNNMNIWDAVSTTDPDRTKRVNQRGGFTAIDASYQIEMATRQFGPIGIGWGYCAKYDVIGELVFAYVTMWHGDRENTFGPIAGCAQLTGNRTDHDAPKKAMTDGITKGLSQLGFNADVFAGKFDDNKYIEDLRKEKRGAAGAGMTQARTDAVLDSLPKDASPRDKAAAFAEAIIVDINKAKTAKGVGNAWNKWQKHVTLLQEKHSDLYSNVFDAWEAAGRE